jgi:regulator of cell morphogenesis and NO signaling
MSIAIDLRRPTDQLEPDMTLAQVALRSDAYAAVLDRFGLDFCCRGGRTLTQACAEAGIDAARVLAELHAQAGAPRAIGVAGAAWPAGADWNVQLVPAVIDFIVDTHHAFTRSAFARLTPLLAKVVARHGLAHPELARVSAAFSELAADLEPHMLREDRVLFPYIRALASPDGAPPPPFGTVRNPVRRMMAEHDRAGELLAEIVDATGGLSAPADACASFRALYAGLAELRLDLLKHVSLENNVLFPRALVLEDDQARRARTVGAS